MRQKSDCKGEKEGTSPATVAIALEGTVMRIYRGKCLKVVNWLRLFAYERVVIDCGGDYESMYTLVLLT